MYVVCCDCFYGRFGTQHTDGKKHGEDSKHEETTETLGRLISLEHKEKTAVRCIRSKDRRLRAYTPLKIHARKVCRKTQENSPKTATYLPYCALVSHLTYPAPSQPPPRHLASIARNRFDLKNSQSMEGMNNHVYLPMASCVSMETIGLPSRLELKTNHLYARHSKTTLHCKHAFSKTTHVTNSKASAACAICPLLIPASDEYRSRQLHSRPLYRPRPPDEKDNSRHPIPKRPWRQTSISGRRRARERTCILVIT